MLQYSLFITHSKLLNVIILNRKITPVLFRSTNLLISFTVNILEMNGHMTVFPQTYDGIYPITIKKRNRFLLIL